MRNRNWSSTLIVSGVCLTLASGCAAFRNGPFLGERIDDPPQLSPYNQPLNPGQQQVTPYRGFVPWPTVVPDLGFAPAPWSGPYSTVPQGGLATVPPPNPYGGRFHSGGPFGGFPGPYPAAPVSPAPQLDPYADRFPSGDPIGGFPGPYPAAPNSPTPQSGNPGTPAPSPGNGYGLPQGRGGNFFLPDPQAPPPHNQTPNDPGTDLGTPRTYEKPVPNYTLPEDETPESQPRMGTEENAGPEETIHRRPDADGLAAPVPSTIPEEPHLPDARTYDPNRQPLALSINDPGQVLLSEAAKFEIVIRNPFQIAVENVVVEVHFDEGLSFPDMPERALRQRLGTLAASQTRTIDLALTAEETGSHCVNLTLTADGRETASERRCVDVIDPNTTGDGVTVDLLGPQARNVGGRMECVLTIENPTGREVSGVIATLDYDTALEPREASAGATRTPGQLVWDLGLLRVGEHVEIQVEFSCPSPSEQACVSAQVRGRDLVSQNRELCAVIHPRTVLDVAIADSRDPVPVGETTTYLVTVTNRGLKSLSDIRIDAELTGGLELISGRQGASAAGSDAGPAAGAQSAAFLMEGPIPPDESRIVRIDVRGTRTGSGGLNVLATEAGTDRRVTADEPTVVNPPLLDAPSFADIAGRADR